MLACTIIAQNYLAQARILAETFLEQVPDGRIVVLVLDPDPDQPMDGEVFEVLTPHDIMDPVEFGQMATLYTIVELATAVKPWLLEHLLQQAPAVTYFDPDIAVFSDPRFVDELAREHGLVLTPHALDPLPRGDALTPGEDVILKAGIYNLGFVAVGGPTGRSVATWWQSRLRRECIIAPEQGRFVDQRWMDLAPSYFDPCVLRHPGCNVAWWNLPTRDVEERDGHWTVNGKDLVFFHFSGYSPDHPYLVSKHQGSAPRVLLSERPVLARLFGWYRDEMLAHGHRDTSRVPYGVNEVDGLPLDRVMREIFREALMKAEASDRTPPPNPFSDGVPAFIEWLSEPVPAHAEGRAPGRYLMRVHQTIPGMRERFPIVPGTDTDAFEDHVRDHLVPDGVVPPALSPAAAPDGDERAVAPTEDLRPGLNVIAYFTAESGVGQAARLITSGLDAADIPHSTVTLGLDVPGRSSHAYADDGVAGAVFDTNLICVNADVILSANHWMGDSLRSNRYRIGLWWWETSVFPERFDESFEVVDEVWAGSEFVAAAIRARTDKPVTVIPMPVPVPPVRTGARRALGVPDDSFLVLYSYDFDSVFERKNPLGAIAAYTQAFGPGDGCTLLLKSVNGDRHLGDLEHLRMAAAGRPDIIIRDEYLDADVNHGLIAECDCYLSLHRSEGFGLTMAEAMAFGRPVVATAYSANLEFMDDTTGYLVPASPCPIPAGAGPYGEGTTWGDPDIDAAAALLRDVHDDPAEARKRGDAARERIETTRSAAATGRAITARMEAIRHEGGHPAAAGDPPAPAHADPARRPLDELALRMRRGGRTPWRNSETSPTGIAHRGLLRVMRPYLQRRAEIDQAEIEVLAALETRSTENRETIDVGLTEVKEDVGARLERIEEGLAELTTFSGAVVSDLGRTLDSIGDSLRGGDHVARDTNRLSRYAALGLLQARYRDRVTDDSDGGDLTPFELRCFSQNGEDGVMDEILWRIGIERGTFVEFGVESGREGNCVLLAEARRWPGLFIEAAPEHFHRLRRRYDAFPGVRTIEACATPGNINALIAGAGLAGQVDVLSIDIDGNDYWVWKAIDVITPAVVCIEYNAHIPVGEVAVQQFDSSLTWDGSRYYGASISALEELAATKGYRLVYTDLAGVNAFFVQQDLAGRFVPEQDVPRRAANFYLRGDEHPEDPLGRLMTNPHDAP